MYAYTDLGDDIVTEKKRKFNGGLIFNLIVIAISVFLVIKFITSEDGLIDLLKSKNSFLFGWAIVAFIVFNLNMLVDSIVTLIYIRMKYPDFKFLDAIKVAFVGVFFGAITPSNTGGQPMQLFVLSKMKVNVGFGSACMTQKFIVYQYVTMSISIFAIIVKFEFFQNSFTDFWSSAFIVLGFLTQLLVTVMFLIICYSSKVTMVLLKLASKLLRKLKFIKNPDGKIKRLKREFIQFHRANKMISQDKKRFALIIALVFVQVLMILSVPYFIYLAFDMPKTAASTGLPVGNLFDFICIQSFVLFTSNLIPLPGASGGAELAFSMYFGRYFGEKRILPAILLWRFIVYYGAMLVTAPFSYYTKGHKKAKLAEEMQEEAKEISENNADLETLQNKT